MILEHCIIHRDIIVSNDDHVTLLCHIEVIWQKSEKNVLNIPLRPDLCSCVGHPKDKRKNICLFF